MIFIKRQYSILLHAISFFTRLPVPSYTFNEIHMKKSIRYFSFIGFAIALVLIGIANALGNLLPHHIIIILILIVSTLLTGAFHEDGFADAMDGLWGGMTPEKRLLIMKDSRLGTYGGLALIFISILKWQCLSNLTSLPKALILAYVLSRTLTTIYMKLYSYHQTAESKSSSIAAQVSFKDIFINILFTLPIILLITGKSQFIILFLVLSFAWFAWARIVKNKIGYFTGDLFGAGQQIFEILIYLCLLIKL